MAAVEGLPEELLTLILAKLPVKSLLQCKCVRKSWYSLIKSPHFINLHRLSSSTSKSFIVTGCPRKVLSFYSYETLDDLGNDISIPFSNERYRDNVSLSAPCDGLVCITNLRDQILICNPALREFRSLFMPPSFGKTPSYSIKYVALGSDPNTAGQFKLLMIRSVLSDEVTEENHEAKMYDFRTDSWRDVVLPSLAFISDRAISLNGAFHWCPWRSVERNILTFHISDEVTGSIPLPDSFPKTTRYTLLFVSSKSQLALVHSLIHCRFEICVLTEYGVKESWTRLCQIQPQPDFYIPLAFWGEQQLLLKDYMRNQLASCDLQHQNVRLFPISGDSDVYPYSESLVSVHGIGEL